MNTLLSGAQGKQYQQWLEWIYGECRLGFAAIFVRKKHCLPYMRSGCWSLQPCHVVMILNLF
jgi:hypothetical protein